MKATLTIIPLCALLGFTSLANAANLAVSETLTTTKTVNNATTDYYQLAAGNTVIINTTGKIDLINAQFQSAIGQNGTGTAVLTINDGGIFTTANAVNVNAKKLWIGNNTIGEVNLDGGEFDGSGLTEFIIGRSAGGAGSTFNILAGTATFSSALTVNAGSWINFTTDSTGVLSVAGYTQTQYEALWNADKLRVDDAVHSGTFGDHFIVSGNTIQAIPELSSTALLGLGGLALILRRRR